MENMCTIAMYIDAFRLLALDVTSLMVTTVYHQTLLPCLTSTPCKGSAKKARANNQIVIFLHKSSETIYAVYHLLSFLLGNHLIHGDGQLLLVYLLSDRIRAVVPLLVTLLLMRRYRVVYQRLYAMFGEECL